MCLRFSKLSFVTIVNDDEKCETLLEKLEPPSCWTELQWAHKNTGHGHNTLTRTHTHTHTLDQLEMKVKIVWSRKPQKTKTKRNQLYQSVEEKKKRKIFYSRPFEYACLEHSSVEKHWFQYCSRMVMLIEVVRHSFVAVSVCVRVWRQEVTKKEEKKK